jgi:uncharacterized protein (DUF697 family)
MNKRRLPKAITRPPRHLREIPLESVADQDADWAPERSAVVVGMTLVPNVSSGPPEPALAPAPRLPAKPRLERRLLRAHAIVERHATYSAAGGLIPLPIANVGSVTAIIVRMVKMLSRLYEVPFERDRARAIVVGLMGGAVPTGLAAVAASMLQSIVPASGIIGLAVSSVTAVASTRSIGLVFIEHFERGTALGDYPTGAGRKHEPPL